MTRYTVNRAASVRIAEIYRYSLDRWGRTRAREYIDGLFDTFDAIANGERMGRPIPSVIGIEGWFLLYRSHFIFWIRREDGRVAIVSVLHKRMKMLARLRDDLEQDRVAPKDMP